MLFLYSNSNMLRLMLASTFFFLDTIMLLSLSMGKREEMVVAREYNIGLFIDSSKSPYVFLDNKLGYICKWILLDNKANWYNCISCCVELTVSLLAHKLCFELLDCEFW
jgi:hypothetical protein